MVLLSGFFHSLIRTGILPDLPAVVVNINLLPLQRSWDIAAIELSQCRLRISLVAELRSPRLLLRSRVLEFIVAGEIGYLTTGIRRADEVKLRQCRLFS